MSTVARRPSRPAAVQRTKPVVRWGLAHALPRALVRVGARRGDLQSRLITEAADATTAQLAPLFEEIRAAGPVSGSRLVYLTVDHSVIKEVLTSNDFRTGMDLGEHPALSRVLTWSARTALHPLEPPSLLVVEPPEHTHYRRLVTKVFTARAVERLRQRTEQIAAQLLDQLPTGEPVDLVDTYCGLLPVTVIAEILGVPEQDRRHVLELGSAAAASLDMGLTWAEYQRVEHALDDFDSWLTEHLQRVRRDPGDDLFSQLVKAADDDRVGLTERELKSTAGLVLAAGFETTVNLFGNGIRLLHDHPEQLQALRESPDLWANAVDEVLRIDPPVMLTSRTATCDTNLAGRQVAAGSMVVTVLAGANRDPAVFPDPDRFDVTRANARDHLSFSAGRHFCLGAALARMEGEVGLRALFDRFGSLELLPGAHRRGTRVPRGYDRLPARMTRS